MDKEFIDRAHLHLTKLKNSILNKDVSGEQITNSFLSARVPLSQIREDDEFKNVRQNVDPEKYEILKSGIEKDGLKSPITVRAGDDSLDKETVFWARAGFRRLRAVRDLGWETIPAIVIPFDTPDIEDYWINLSENCHREAVTPYEIACQARHIIAKYGSSINEVSRRTALSPGIIADYVKYLQYLPDDVLAAWRGGHPGLTRQKLNTLSFLTPWEASARWRKDQNKLPLDPSLAGFSTRRVRKIRIASFELMQNLHHHLGIERSITHEARKLAQRCLEICMGSRPVIEGIWPPKRISHIVNPKYWPEGLDLPEPANEVRLATEGGKPVFEMTDDDSDSYSLDLRGKGKKK